MVRSCSTGGVCAWTGTAPPAGWLRRLAEVSVARLPRMYPHTLRRAFGTTVLDAGVDLRDFRPHPRCEAWKHWVASARDEPRPYHRRVHGLVGGCVGHSHVEQNAAIAAYVRWCNAHARPGTGSPPTRRSEPGCTTRPKLQDAPTGLWQSPSPQVSRVLMPLAAACGHWTWVLRHHG